MRTYVCDVCGEVINSENSISDGTEKFFEMSHEVNGCFVYVNIEITTQDGIDADLCNTCALRTISQATLIHHQEAHQLLPERS